MRHIRRFLTRLGLGSERRERGVRVPIHVGARLELDEVTLRGTARDIGLGGVFFETVVPLAEGVRGAIARDGSRDRVPVRVGWARRAGGEQPAGLGLVFESNDRK